MSTREERFEKKRTELMVHCNRCRSRKYKPSIEQCDECSIGRKIRMLEVEYSDVTGWSHSKWKK